MTLAPVLWIRRKGATLVLTFGLSSLAVPKLPRLSTVVLVLSGLKKLRMHWASLSGSAFS